MDRDELIRIVEEFKADKYPDGVYEIYADYRDELSDKQALKIIKSKDPSTTFYEILEESYLYTDSYYQDALDKEFEDWCEYHDYDVTIDDLRSEDVYLDEYITFELPYDHFLDQEYYCRLIVDNGDANYDFTRNPNQDNGYQIESGAGIIWLGEQLGYTVEQMQQALDSAINPDEYPIDHKLGKDKFLDSLIQEAANAFGCPALTFLCKMSLKDLIKVAENHADVKVELNDMGCGFFDGYNGGGSVLELECGKKDIIIPNDKIYQLVPDIKCNGMYSVDEVYGLWKGAYADAEAI